MVETGCRVCGEPTVAVFYRQEGVPIHSALLLTDRNRAVRYPRGDIRLGFCETCGFIANLAFESQRLAYGDAYDGTQSFSATFDSFHRRLAEQLVERQNLRGRRIVEVGCGRGEFLDLLCALGDNRGVGFDPSRASEPASSEQSRMSIVRDYFPNADGGTEADFVCCKMTLEHIAEPVPLLRAIRASLTTAPTAGVFLQVPDAAQILTRSAFWDVYYEHCSYFTAASLAALSERCGFSVDEQWNDYEGQYLLQIARPSPGGTSSARTAEMKTLRESVASFAERSSAAIADWRAKIADQARRRRRIVLWGAGSKAVAFLAATGTGEQISCLVDINPHKQGTYAPGTGHPIVAPSALHENAPDVVIAMNPIYRDEIAKDLRSMGLHSELWSL